MSVSRILDVPGLGYDATFVEMDDETLLLIDADLDHDARMAVLTRAIGQALE